ncbi:MAG: hypothetical protein HUJ69_02750, partial [Lachnospiraceae bacterium]|nr:hypothetical protein [Lachnospiraceae bacterium]
MKKMNRRIGKRILAFVMSVFMLIGMLPLSALAADENTPTTKRLNDLLTGFELSGEGVELVDGVYSVKPKTNFTLSLHFRENDSWEYDMTDYIYYELPAGVAASVDGVTGSVVIGVQTSEAYMPIDHNYEIKDNKLYVYWNKEDKDFADLSLAHYVTFDFNMSVKFDGTQSEVKFIESDSAKVNVDKTGTITVTKKFSGFMGNDRATLLDGDSEAAKAAREAVTFELWDKAGTVLKTFTYDDMNVNDKGDHYIQFDDMEPGTYYVKETGHPDFALYTFDAEDSVLNTSGELEVAGDLSMGLTNDYDYYSGSLALYKSIDWTNWDGSKTLPSDIGSKITFTVTGPFGYSKKDIKYSEFKDGIYTLENLPVGTYTVTEKNTVTGYTWTYTINGETAEKAEVEVKKDDIAVVKFANTYDQKVGNLEIVKIAAGATVPADTKFTVTFPDKSTKTFYYKEMTDGKYVFKNVPLGEYSVAEDHGSAGITNYKLVVTGEGTKKVLEGQTSTTTITNTYTELGSLKITKTIAGDLDASKMTKTQKQAIKFTITGPNNYKKSITFNDFTDADKDGIYEYTLKDLPAGTYTVVESGSVSGYTQVTVPADKTCTADVKLGGTAQADFTNTYTQIKYTLVVNKEVAGVYTSLDTLPEEVKKGLGFKVIDANGNVTTYTYADFGKKLVLTAPGPYTINEINPDLSGTGITVTSQVSTDGTNYTVGISVGVTLNTDNETVVYFKNTYDHQGKIIVDKTVLGLTKEEEEVLRTQLLFAIYHSDGNVFKDNLTLEDLKNGIAVPVGRYYVQEYGGLAVKGYNPAITSWVIEAVASGTDTKTNAFDVKKNEEIKVSYTNEYTRPYGPGDGEFKLEKLVSGLDEIGTDEKGELKVIKLTKELEVKNTKGKILYEGITFKIEEKKVIANKTIYYYVGEYTLDQFTAGQVKLPVGTYRLTELGYEVTGYKNHITFKFESGIVGTPKQTAPNQIEFTIDETTALKVEVRNVYAHIGNLEIKKTFSGDDNAWKNWDGTKKKSIKFTVTGPHDYKQTFTYYDLEKAGGIKKFFDVPIGEYTITESNGAQVTNYTLTVSYTNADESGKATVKKGETTTVTINNDYQRQKASLTIIKVMAGDYPVEWTDEQKEAMVFQIVQTGNSNVIRTVTYKDFEGGKYTFTDLSTNVEYKVVETIGGVLTNVYNVEIDNNEAKFTLEFGKNTEITITNTFTQTGSLKVVKEFEGAELTAAEKASVKFVITGPNNYERTA